MPRQSAEALRFPSVKATAWLSPPRGLEKETSRVFRRIVGSSDPQHFVEADAPLLVEYCRAVLLAEQADRELRTGGPVVGGKTSPWIVIQEKAQRAMTALALRLRICPQARQDPKTVARRSKGPSPSVYEMENHG